MQVSATELRGNLYQFLDQVIATGQALEIKRHGQILEVIPKSLPAQKKQQTFKLVKHEAVINGDPDDLVHMDWSCYWNQGALQFTLSQDSPSSQNSGLDTRPF